MKALAIVALATSWLLIAPSANAAVVIKTSSSAMANDNVNLDPLTVAAFDPGLGDLTQIRIQYNVDYDASDSVSFPTHSPPNISYTASYSIIGVLGDMGSDVYLRDSASKMQSASGCGYDCTGTSIPDTSTVSVSGSGTITQNEIITDSATLALFTGSAPLSFDDQLTARNGSATGSFKIAYVYTPAMTSPASVPEPATWATTIIGFCAVGAAMRRRQRTSVRLV